MILCINIQTIIESGDSECAVWYLQHMGMVGDAMVLGKLPVPGRPTNLD